MAKGGGATGATRQLTPVKDAKKRFRELGDPNR